MRYHTIAEILAANRAANDRFTSSLSGLTGPQANYKMSGDSWSICEITEHVNIVGNGFLRITHKLLKAAEADGKPPKPDLDLGPTALDEEGNQPPKFMAPQQVHPSGSVPIAESLASLNQTIDGFDEIRSRIEAVEMGNQTFPHPAFGSLNAYQWLILLGEHTDRHRLQIENIKRCADFPS